MLQCAAVCYIVLPLGSGIRGWVYCVLQCVAVCCSVSQCVIVHCHWAVAYAAVYFEVCCSVLQCVAVCYSALPNGSGVGGCVF